MMNALIDPQKHNLILTGCDLRLISVGDHTCRALVCLLRTPEEDHRIWSKRRGTSLVSQQTSQWNPALEVGVPGAGNSGCVGSMAETALQNPRHLDKRRRLSRLLDKLAVQLRNNNHYPPPPWLMFHTNCEEEQAEEAPLDLSLKSEPTPVPEEPKYTCDACGQTFTVHDRLAKHVASRHRHRTPEASRAYECEVCRRRFARSDMLTRHARLHSGVKPYSCSSCGQVFSRSDHLATHQRTHTGEKPYRCPACPYAACRRDMITRHMRTHSRRPQPA